MALIPSCPPPARCRSARRWGRTLAGCLRALGRPWPGWGAGSARQVAVGDAADVPPFGGVLAQPFPGLFFQLQPEPFRDALLDAADENGGGADPGDISGLVGGEQRDALVVEFAFQFEGVVGVAGGAFDVFDHDGGEPGLRGPCLGQQVGQAAVAGMPCTGLYFRSSRPAAWFLFARERICRAWRLCRRRPARRGSGLAGPVKVGTSCLNDLDRPGLVKTTGTYRNDRQEWTLVLVSVIRAACFS